MKILVTGSNGLLGQKIIAQLLNRKIDFKATSLGVNRNTECPDEKYSALDITDQAQVSKLFTEYEPSIVIHTAAMTNVDACESSEDTCRKINVTGTKNCFQASKLINAQFILLSTDFVFDGENGPYSEDDNRNPLSIYAKSKVDAENILAKDTYKEWAILRTIIVFGKGINLSRSNIVLWAYEALKSGKTLTIVNDQFRAPTWADDLAWACIETGTQKKTGIFHIAGPKTFAIYDLVVEIANFYNFDSKLIEPIPSSNLNQKAKRPPKTGFVLTKAMKELGYKPKEFTAALKALDLR